MLSLWVSASHQTNKKKKNIGRQGFALEVTYTCIDKSPINSMAVPEEQAKKGV